LNDLVQPTVSAQPYLLIGDEDSSARMPDLYQGAPDSKDPSQWFVDPVNNVAKDGNQVGGSFGLTWAGTTYVSGSSSTDSAFLIQDPASYEAVSAQTFLAAFGSSLTGTPTVLDTFDASDSNIVDTGNNEITLSTTAWGLLSDGDPVLYGGSAGVIGGLTDATIYYVKKATSPDVQLALSYKDAIAGTAITLSSVGTGSHTLSYYDRVSVTRSTAPTNQAMGYTYTITYDHYDVGGDVAPLTNTLTNLKPSASAGLTFVEQTPGTALQGTFQLRFNGQTTGPIAYNENAMSVQAALNELSSISPSEVVVTRSGPMRTGGSKGSPGTQVEGYVWSITFMSNVWKDPTVAHDASSVPGNWVGAAALWTDTWDTGFSKAWGKNVGDMPAITCVDTALYTTNGALPSDGCAVAEYTKGSDPLGGTFTVCLDTTGHDVINIQGVQCTGAIAHNAYASAADSGGDGSSMEEKLEALTNIGDLAVSRSNVNMGGNNGGYTWTVTFLRDDDVSGGQFGGCEQKDDANQLCNSPGNVPKFCDAGSCAPNVASMKGSCDNTNVFSSYTPYQTWHSAVPDGKLLGITVTAGGTGYGSAPAVTIGAPDHCHSYRRCCH
jgi:hypothetical protein